jgi:hypothetical protein
MLPRFGIHPGGLRDTGSIGEHGRLGPHVAVGYDNESPWLGVPY